MYMQKTRRDEILNKVVQIKDYDEIVKMVNLGAYDISHYDTYEHMISDVLDSVDDLEIEGLFGQQGIHFLFKGTKGDGTVVFQRY